MKAKKKPIEEIVPSQLGVDPAEVGPGAKTETVSLEPPPMRAEGKKFTGEPRESVLAVLKALREEQKLL
jgi:electron transfer flavoprotein beta subunit